MTTPKHTPGPWITERCDTGMEILDTKQESVAVACHFGDPYSSIREEANARLIAAAPDTLDTLQAILEWTESRDGDARTDENIIGAIGQMARAAISKATGQE